MQGTFCCGATDCNKIHLILSNLHLYSSCSTFAMVDSTGHCLPVTLYNMNVHSGFVVGDSVAIPEPFLQLTDFTEDDKVMVMMIMMTNHESKTH